MRMNMLLRSWFLLPFMWCILYSSTFTVSQDGRGEYSTVQEAISNAMSGDEVVILDFAVYKEQVTIDSSKNRLILRSENPKLKSKPTILYQDKTNVGPRNYEESQDQSKINFDMNGAARVLRAQGVVIEGIIFDGGGPAPYGYSGIWERKDPLFSGNAALTLYVAGDAVVRNCEFRNAYFGIYLKDRNEGGIYANANPADLQPQLIVPLSGFGKTGNHLIEQNRIHNNAWGMFIESAWDLGSTIRYNLFYENTVDEKLAEEVDPLPGSDNQWGGAITFKDVLLTPMAIYNNTFYHNNLCICVEWQVGGVNLVFNNIFSEPIQKPAQGIAAQILDVAIPNRLFSCLYACQEDTPQTRSQNYTAGASDPETNQYVQGSFTYTGIGYLSVTSGFPAVGPTAQIFNIDIPLSSGVVKTPVTVDWGILPGSKISTATPNMPFPESANNRWLETKFKSTDPEDPDFLTPDWEDSVTTAFIVDQGWAAGGIRDADGTIADIGAIPLGGIPETEVIIKPKDPVFITGGTSAKVSFTINPIAGEMKNPKIKYVRWIRNVQYAAGIWGNSTIKKIPTGDIFEVSIPSTPLAIGSNTLTFTIPAMTSAYGFFDIIIEGTTADGKTITTNAGFLPYRAIDYVFDVVVMDAAGATELTKVQAGQAVQLWITPKRLDGKPFEAEVEKVSVSLASNFNLLTPGGEVFSIPGRFKGTSKSQVVFTKVPESGFDNVEVSGKFTNPTDTSIWYAIRGSSKDITVIPGPPEKISFQNPPSNGIATVDPGTLRPVTVQAYDHYGNKIASATEITVVSTKPDIGKINGSPAMTDEHGLATLTAQVTKGELYDTFPIIATLTVNNAADNAKLVVGKPRDRFIILYSDTAGYDPAVSISACSGIRVPVTIRATKDGLTAEKTYTTVINLEVSSGLCIYLTESIDDTARITETSLVNGSRVVWVKSTLRNIVDGSIMVYAKDGSIVSATRGNINFIPCNTGVKRAAYFASNGFGMVDRAEVYFEKKLEATEIPDSIRLSWPSSTGEMRMVKRSAIAIDPQDSSHLTVTLITPFSKEITRYIGSNAQLGTYYWWNPLTPDAPYQTKTFAVADSVGPLIASATLVEKPSGGNDSLYISFTEAVDKNTIAGKSLTLIKNGLKIQLDITGVLPIDEQTFVAVAGDLLGNSPAEGDSLMITAAGPVTDISNNRAHFQNRPVQLSVKKVHPVITAAGYRDENADGVIDRVIVTFNKKIDPATTQLRLVWNGDSAIKTFTAADFQVIEGEGGKSIGMVITAGLFGTANMQGVTSGDMAVKAVFTEYTGENSDVGKVSDQAAPVLIEVRYCIANDIDAVVVPDTVKVVFSEAAVVKLSDPVPLLFKNDFQSYSLNLNGLRGSVTEYVYVVAGQDIEPVKNDSAWINADASRAIVADNSGNIQLNPNNRKVRLILEANPELQVLIGPNPLTPADGGFCYLILKPKIKSDLIVDSVKASAVIYDKVGNKVKEFPMDTKKGFVEFKWDGSNLHNRFVGNGSYLVIASGSLVISGTESRKIIHKSLIGIQR